MNEWTGHEQTYCCISIPTTKAPDVVLVPTKALTLASIVVAPTTKVRTYEDTHGGSYPKKAPPTKAPIGCGSYESTHLLQKNR